MGTVRTVVKSRWPFCLVLGLAALALYLPTLTHEFVNYDDQQYVTENRHVRAGLTTDGLGWACGKHADNWHPLTWLSHMLDCEVYGLRPWGHHLTNALFHAGNTVLLFLLLSRMTGSRWRSAVAAALFAWHPLHVESVAWVAERKDVLSGFFFFLTILAYVGYVGAMNRTNRTCRPVAWYLLALLLFALGLMSKPMLVTVPFVLLLLDYWPLERGSGVEGRGSSADARSEKVSGQRSVVGGLLMEKVPFLALSFSSCLLTLSAQRGAIVDPGPVPIWQRLGHAILGYGHYLKAMFLPLSLAVYYPRGEVEPGWEIALVGVFLSLIMLTAGWLAFRTIAAWSQSGAAERPALRSGWLFTGWFWFLGMLVPVIGLVQVGDQAWADRYTYLPSVGVFMAVVWGVAQALERSVRSDKSDRSVSIWQRAALGSSILLLGACALLTLSQLRYWKDTRSLFEHAAKVTDRNPVAATVLGSLLDQEGKVDEAIVLYRQALSYSPKCPEAHYFLGRALEKQDRLDEAIAEYRQALPYERTAERARICFGAALERQNQTDAAVAQYLAALKLNPESVVPHNNIGRILQKQGKLDEARNQYLKAIECDPDFPQAHNNLGILFLQQGRLAEGTSQLRAALRLKPTDPQTELNLAQALAQQEQWSEAAAHFGKTVTAAIQDPNLHYQYAVVLAHLHKSREAMSQYASALLLKQDFPAALDGLSWVLATSPDPALRNGPEAVRMAEHACEFTGRRDAAKLRTLAAAYAEAGRFADAQATINAAIELWSTTGDQESAKQNRQLLEQFRKAQPWREGP